MSKIKLEITARNGVVAPAPVGALLPGRVYELEEELANQLIDHNHAKRIGGTKAGRPRKNNRPDRGAANAS